MEGAHAVDGGGDGDAVVAPALDESEASAVNRGLIGYRMLTPRCSLPLSLVAK